MDKLHEIKERLEKATPEPWEWVGSTKNKYISLETPKFGRHTIMGFDRWGLNGACPVFMEPSFDGTMNLQHKQFRVLERGFKWLKERQSHHEGWDMDIDHPDAQLIAHAPEDIRYLIAEVERLQAESAAMREALMPYRKDFGNGAYAIMCPVCNAYLDSDGNGAGHAKSCKANKALSTNAGKELLDGLHMYEQEAEKIHKNCSLICHMGKDIDLLRREVEFHPPYRNDIKCYEYQESHCPKICPKYKGGE